MRVEKASLFQASMLAHTAAGPAAPAPMGDAYVPAPADPDLQKIATLRRIATTGGAVRHLRLDTRNSIQSLAVTRSGDICACTEGPDTAEVRRLAPDGSTRSLYERPRAKVGHDHFFYHATPAEGSSRTLVADAQDRRIVAVDGDVEAWTWSSGRTRGNLYEPVPLPDGRTFFSGDGFAALIGPQGKPEWQYDATLIQPGCGHDSAWSPRNHAGYLLGIQGIEAVRDGHTAWSLPADRNLVFTRMKESPTAGLYATAFNHARPPGSGRLYALDDDGHVRWTFDTPTSLNGITPAPTPDGGVLFTDHGGTLYRLDAEGTLLWKRDLRDPHNGLLQTALDGFKVRDDALPSSPVLTRDGSAYVALDASFFCFDAQGVCKGRIDLGDPADGATRHIQTPCVTDQGEIYLHDWEQGITVIDAPRLFDAAADTGAPAVVRVEADHVVIGGIRIPVRR